MSIPQKYKLINPEDESLVLPNSITPRVDRMVSVSTYNRIAQVCLQKFIQMLNNTQMLKMWRITSIDEVLMYLTGMHHDVGQSGNRGDFYRRKLAEQIFVNCAIEGVDHENVMEVVYAAIDLEKKTREVLITSARTREIAPHIDIDEMMLDTLAKIANIY